MNKNDGRLDVQHLAFNRDSQIRGLKEWVYTQRRLGKELLLLAKPSVLITSSKARRLSVLLFFPVFVPVQGRKERRPAFYPG